MILFVPLIVKAHDRDNPGFPALALSYGDTLSFKVYVTDIKFCKLLTPEPQPVEGLKDRAVAEVMGCHKELFNLEYNPTKVKNSP
jgi:hypothetical protein